MRAGRGEGNPTLPSGVLVVFDEPGQAEVSDLTQQVVSHQDVGGAQVSVDIVHPLDVGHAGRHLEHATESTGEIRLRGSFIQKVSYYRRLITCYTFG